MLDVVLLKSCSACQLICSELPKKYLDTYRDSSPKILNSVNLQLFQTCMILFHLLNIKDILKNANNQTLWVPTDFHRKYYRSHLGTDTSYQDSSKYFQIFKKIEGE